MKLFQLNRKGEVGYKDVKMKLMLVAIVTLSIFFSFNIRNWVLAEIPSSGYAVDYEVDYAQETIAIAQGTGASTKFYFSTDNRKNWTFIDITTSTVIVKGVTKQGVVFDISTMLKSKATTIYVKGNKDTFHVPVILQGEGTALKPKYQVDSFGKGMVTWEGPSEIEYKKGSNGVWVKTLISSKNTIYTEMYELTGATFYMRTVPTKGQRASKPVTFRIPKKANGPSVKLDGSKLLITGLNAKTMEYRKNDAMEWIPVLIHGDKTKTFDLKNLFVTTGTNVPAIGGVLEVRVKATEKKPASLVKVIEIPTQPVITAAAVKFVGTQITISDANKAKPYEYAHIPASSSATVTPETARWTAITSNKPVIVKKAARNDKIYIRMKTITNKDTKIVTPASTYVVYPVETITLP